jgi:hypothetical protein
MVFLITYWPDPQIIQKIWGSGQFILFLARRIPYSIRRRGRDRPSPPSEDGAPCCRLFANFRKELPVGKQKVYCLQL